MQRHFRNKKREAVIAGVCDSRLDATLRKMAQATSGRFGFCVNVNDLVGKLLRSEARVAVVEAGFVGEEMRVFLEIVHRLDDRIQVFMVAASSAEAHNAGLETGRGVVQVFTGIPSERTLSAFFEQALDTDKMEAIMA